MLERAGKSFIAIEAVRTKYFDDVVEYAVSKDGISQFVVLGSGLDSRPYRLSVLPLSGSWFEIDYKSVLEYKRKTLETAKPFISIVHVPADLLNVSLTQLLVTNGFEGIRDS